MKLLVFLCFIFNSACSVYQSYGRKNFEEQSATASLIEQLQLTVKNCESPNNTNGHAINKNLTQINEYIYAETSDYSLTQIEHNNYDLLNKKNNEICNLTGNPQEISKYSVAEILDIYIISQQQNLQDDSQ